MRYYYYKYSITHVQLYTLHASIHKHIKDVLILTNMYNYMYYTHYHIKYMSYICTTACVIINSRNIK